MTQNTSTRRKALKLMLASGGGLTAAAFLPARWLKPIVQSGVLPAHAQTSGCALITRTVAVGNITFEDYSDSQSFPFVEGDITQAMLATCAYSRITLRWTSGANTPANDAYIALQVDQEGTSETMFVGPTKGSPVTLSGISANLVYDQYIGIEIGPDWELPDEAFSYGWNVGTLTLIIS